MKTRGVSLRDWKSMRDAAEAPTADIMDRSAWERARPRFIWEIPPKNVGNFGYHTFIDELEAGTELRPGDSLLIAVRGEHDATAFVARKAQQGSSFQLHGDLLNAWEDARAAVPQSATCAPAFGEWAQTRNRPNIRLLRNTHGSIDARRWAPLTLDGQSFGLGFALSLISSLFDIPVKSEVAGLSGCTPNGKLRSVDGMKQKVAHLELVAPRVRTVVVAEKQPHLNELRRTFSGHTFIECANLEAALSHAFGAGSIEGKVQAKLDKMSPDELIKLADTFFGFVLFEKFLPNSFFAIARTAEMLSDALAKPAATCSDAVQARAKAQFARAVACRHENKWDASLNAMWNDLMSMFRWQDLGFPQKWRVSAHIVQQGYDLGNPTVSQLKKLFAGEAAAAPSEVSRDQLPFLGAWARLLEREGAFSDALKRQAALVTAHLDASSYEETTYPLSQAFHLAGVLRDPDRFNELDALWKGIRPRLPEDYNGVDFVRVARFRALVLLRRDAEAEAMFGGIGDLMRRPEHLRTSYARFAVRLSRIPSVAQDAMFNLLKDSGSERSISDLIGEFEQAVLDGDTSAQNAAVCKMIERDKLFAAIHKAVCGSSDFNALRKEGHSNGRLAVDAYPY